MGQASPTSTRWLQGEEGLPSFTPWHPAWEGACTPSCQEGVEVEVVAAVGRPCRGLQQRELVQLQLALQRVVLPVAVAGLAEPGRWGG